MNADQQGHGSRRGRKLEKTKPQGRSISLECPSSTQESPGGLVPNGVSSTDVFIISRLGDTTSYFFSWFCKKYRIRIGARDLGAKEETQSRCPICLDAYSKSTIELRCGHSFCRSCLTRSAANNMTSCALCREEQEINPELLRARFDEQRMLNLAQRLAIPPPLRPRPSASAVSMTAAEVEREGKGGPSSRGAPTMPKEMLFGPWGDVGAMSADDLRRRWEFSGEQMSTVGAASASDIRYSWRQLTHCMYMQGDGDQSRVDSASCSGDTDIVVHDVGDSARRSPTASPGSSSPVAGGSSPDDLSIRWRSLTKVSLNINISSDEVWGDTGSLDAACLRKRWLEANGLDAVGHLEVGELSERLNHVIGSQGSGGLSSAGLRESWLEANGLDGSVGHVELRELSERLNHGIGSQDSGGLSAVDLRKRWLEATGLDSSVGHVELRELSERLNNVIGSQDSGGLSSACLRTRWLEAGGHESGVGHLEVGQMSERLNLAIGSQGSGGLSAAGLRKRWLEVNGLDSSVGDVNVYKLSERLNHAIDSQGSGGCSVVGLRRRWLEANGVHDGVGDSNVYDLSERLNQAMGPQGVGAIVGTDLEKRWNADLHQDLVDNGYSVFKEAIGVVSTSAARSSWCSASGSAPVG